MNSKMTKIIRWGILINRRYKGEDSLQKKKLSFNIDIEILLNSHSIMMKRIKIIEKTQKNLKVYRLRLLNIYLAGPTFLFQLTVKLFPMKKAAVNKLKLYNYKIKKRKNQRKISKIIIIMQHHSL